MPVLLALAAAVSWGTSDFLGGVASRRGGRVNAVTLAAQLTGLITYLPVAVVVGGTLTGPDIWWALAAGVGSGVGIYLLYAGFTRSHTGIVAPTAAILTAALPFVFGVLTGEDLGPLRSAGVGLGLIAIWMVSRSGGVAPGFESNSRLGVAYGAGAGTGFALMFILLDQLSAGSGGWGVVPLRVGGLLVMLALSMLARLPMIPAKSLWMLILAAGFVGSIGNLAFILATNAGDLAIVAIVASMFPAATVGLAYLFMGERLRRLQQVGVALALVAVGFASAT